MPTEQEAKNSKDKKGSGLLLKLLIVVLVITIVGVSVVGFMSYGKYSEMKNIVDTNTIYKNIFINDVAVGEMTKEQANAALIEKFKPDLENKKITITNASDEYEFTFGDFDANYDFSEAVEKAYSYARTGTVKDRYEKIISLNETPVKLEAEPKYTCDTAGIRDRVIALENKMYVAPVNAAITRVNGRFSISQEKPGKKLNVDDAVTKMTELLAANSEGNVAATFEDIQPEYSAEDFNDAHSLIGTFYTQYVDGNTGRNINIKTAISKINDVVVYPDEIFSTNKAFGPSTYENGYRPASVIVAGEIVDDLGGGVCQVSSTLYNALLYSELEIVERQNHSMKVGYLDYGFDATLAGDYIDLKFRNNTKFPVFIESYVEAGKIVVNLYGHEEHEKGRELSFISSLVETVPAGAEKIVDDPELPLGQRVTKTPGKTGYKYDVYKIVKQNGVEVERVLVNKSYYRPVRAVVSVGTGANVLASNTEAIPETPVAQAPAAQAPPGIDNTEYPVMEEEAVPPSEVFEPISNNDVPVMPE